MNNLKYLEELVSIKSFSTDENKEIIDYLIEKFTPYSTEILKVQNSFDKRESLVIGLNTPLKNTKNAIIRAGHIDTVIADEKAYQTNPYNLTIKNGKAYGLGSIDMKSFFAVILNNIEKLKSLKTPIIIIATGDEETTLGGAEAVKEKLISLGIVPKCSIVGEPTSSKICSKSKSCYEYQVDITGLSCHSSNPKNGANANYPLAKLVLLIESLAFKYPQTTTSCNVLQGGEKVNIISNKATMLFDIRTFNQKYADKIIEKIEKYSSKLAKKDPKIKIEVTKVLGIPLLEKKNPALIEQLKKEFSLEEKDFVGGCEAGYYQAIGGDAFVFGVGDLSLAHKPNEFAEISEFEKYNEMFIKLIEKL